MNEELQSYYRARAKEYDKVYLIPEEQQDLADATTLFQRLFSGKNVLEVACGTGYWTEQISRVAASILATDINENVIEIARSRDLPETVSFEVVDMFQLETENRFDALFGGFIWSHILLQDLNGFLQKMSGFLQPGSVFAFIDSKPVVGGYHDKRSITQTDAHGNTYQTRTLEDGTQHVVLKNFPTREFLVTTLSGIASNIQYVDLKHYWIVCGKV
ncbi:MAG: methyltransferase domain-containing protein [Bacteroidetes bacterium]|nr:methyltransferase domain-containing protein [Bacteroidota bacterium]